MADRRCIYHLDPKTHMVLGGHVYCCKTRYVDYGKTRDCWRNIHCAKCDLPRIKHYMCAGVDGRDNCRRITDLCTDCGDFGMRDVQNPSNLDFLCPECMVISQARRLCPTCDTPVTAANKSCRCACCDSTTCTTCDSGMLTNVDISPITLHGAGFSVAQYTSICGNCRPSGSIAKAVKAVQTSHRHTGAYRCTRHDTFEFCLERSHWVVCAKYRSKSGNPKTLISILDNHKRTVHVDDDPSSAKFALVDAYCRQHPEKHVGYDSHGMEFPVVYTIDNIAMASDGVVFLVASRDGHDSKSVWMGSVDSLSQLEQADVRSYVCHNGYSYRISDSSPAEVATLVMVLGREKDHSSHVVKLDGSVVPLDGLRVDLFKLVSDKGGHLKLVRRGEQNAPSHYITNTGIEIRIDRTIPVVQLKYPGTTTWVEPARDWITQWYVSTKTWVAKNAASGDELYLPGNGVRDNIPRCVLLGRVYSVYPYSEPYTDRRAKRRKEDPDTE